MKTIAIIPARGGSKGIPRKNVIDIAGKPLLAWNIEAAVASRLVDAVYISTDDSEIKKVAHQYGAQVIDRPAELAGDTATSESALIHALGVLSKQGINPDLLVFMQCTSPLTATEDIDAAVQKLLDEKADSCLTVTKTHFFLWKENSGAAEGVNHDKRFRPRRQDLEAEYVENGAVYVLRTDGFIAANHRFFGKTVMSVMPKKRSYDIDEMADLQIAEALLQQQSASGVTHVRTLPIKPPKAVLFDFDGVFTNNKVYVDEQGIETVRCDRSDGWGLAQLKNSGMKIAVLSTEVNPVVTARCKKLGLECYQGLGEKKYEAFVSWCDKNAVKPQDVVFVGNDQNDVDCLKVAGCGVVPADGYPQARECADLILSHKGGDGAVREVCEMILGLVKE